MHGSSTRLLWCVATLVAILSSASFSAAQDVTPFQLVGHIQRLTLDTPADPLSSAKLTVNGIQVIIPKNLVIQLPAAYMTAQQIFEQAQGVSKDRQESGLALGDQFPPLAAFEVTVDGNVVNGEYRAGLVSISQQSLNLSAGYLHHIDLPTGMMCVGGSKTATTCQGADTRIRLNDPDIGGNTGRYGRANPPPPPIGPPATPNLDSRYPDPRFTVDQGNPTVHALTGYPMCVPRTASDALCPAANRPSENTFVMGPNPLIPPIKFANGPIPPCPTCDQTKQAPLKVGDHVTFAGTLAHDANGTYLSVHTLEADVGIYTAPGVDPAYVLLGESLLGTKGPTALCAGDAECQDRLKVEGFTTDPSRTVRVYALDVPPGGSPTVRLLHGTEKVQAVFGRFRYVPPLTAAALFDFNGVEKGATRELMVRIEGGSSLPDGSGLPAGPLAANGLVAGIYVAPVGEYIFPEPTGVQGRALPGLNFQCLAFLVNGWALPDSGLPTIGRLNPWPGPNNPVFTCQ